MIAPVLKAQFSHLFGLSDVPGTEPVAPAEHSADKSRESERAQRVSHASRHPPSRSAQTDRRSCVRVRTVACPRRDPCVRRPFADIPAWLPASKPEGSAHRPTARRPETRRGGTGRPRPASAVRKTVAARTLADARPRGEYGCAWATDVRRTDAPVVVWDLRGSQRPNSPRGIAAPVFLLRWASLIGRTKRGSAARGPLQTAAAAQHRHGARGRQVWDQGAAGFSPPGLWRPASAERQRTSARLAQLRKAATLASTAGSGAPCRVRGASGSPRRSHIATDARCGQRASSVRKMRRRRGGPRRRRFATDVRNTRTPN